MSLANGILNLRHLCSLGLPGERLLPEFLQTLNEILPADSWHFGWTDADGNPVNYYATRAGTEAVAIEYFRHYATIAMPFVGGSMTPVELLGREQVAWTSPESSRTGRTPALYFEIAQALNASHILMGTVRDERRPFGCLAAIRQTRHDFCAAELQSVRDVKPYLRYALSAPASLAHEPEAPAGTEGMAILGLDGTIRHIDEAGRRMMFMAVHPHLDIRKIRHTDDLFRPLTTLCQRLVAMTQGRDGRPPRLLHRNQWGSFEFRAHWLSPPESANAHDLVAVAMRLNLPRRVLLWRGIRALGLPPRLQEACLLFAVGHTYAEIARRMNVTRHTAIDHLRKVYERLEIPANRDSLIATLLAAAANIPWTGSP